MDVKDYLKRIGIEREITPDFEALCLIQRQHMLTVPFENIDIMESRQIMLNMERLYDKIVIRRRGGYCHELNGLLHWALEELGYSSTMISACVARDDGTFGPEFGHTALVVHFSQDYLVDVGFGDSVRSPLPLSGETVTDVSGSYRVRREEHDETTLLFQKYIGETWVTEFTFTLTPRSQSEFVPMNEYQQTSPESHFTRKLICSMATVDGRVTISGDQWITTTGTNKVTVPIDSVERRNVLLAQYFGIDSKR